MKLTTKLNCLNRYPFHMPGHKRNGAFNIVGSDIDITEIDGFDNLHNPTGVLLDIENRLSAIYKSEKSFMLVNGSTGGILSAVFALCKENDKIIIARNCHKSVYNACMLRKLRVSYIEPGYDYANGCYKRIDQQSIDLAVKENPDAAAIVITSPTYEGMISNVRSPIPMIIDAAHGAHLGIGLFPAYPRADIVISSLHKTLPALTQCAVANIYNKKYISAFKQYNDIFETSSPSYVLMSSVDKCCDFIENSKGSFNDYYRNLCEFRTIELENLRLEYCDDISKIIISAANADINGTKLADILRKDYAIEIEMASLNYIIAMTSVADSKEALDRLKAALVEIDGRLSPASAELLEKPPVAKGSTVISIDDNGAAVDLSQGVNRRSNEFVYAYPPDIPIIVPNEIITRESVLYLKGLIKSGVCVISDSNLLPNKLLTKQEQ